MEQGRAKVKSLKVSEMVHKKLKLYCVENNEMMIEFVDTAILSRLAIKTENKPKKK